METVTLSSKYQVVIPKRLRRELNLKAGQKLRIRTAKDGTLEISTKSALDELYGSVKGAWGDDPAAYIRKQRDDWERHQQKLDDLRK
jgi:AbrB family looped-hinge helix DNA binding protein